MSETGKPIRVTYLEQHGDHIYVGHGDPTNDKSPASGAFASVATTPDQHNAVLGQLASRISEQGPLTRGNGAVVLGEAVLAVMPPSRVEPHQQGN